MKIEIGKKKSKNPHPAAVGLTGFAIGAAAGVAIAAMADPKNRAKLSDAASKAGDKAKLAYNKANTKMQQTLRQAEPQIEKGRRALEQASRDLSESAEDTIAQASKKGGATSRTSKDKS